MGKMIKTGRTILIYGLTGLQQLALTAMANDASIRCRFVSDSETSFTIAQLLSEKSLPSRPERSLIGKFALLDGFEGEESEATALINRVTPGVIKAVHTKHNSSWKFFDLCSAIQAEHLTMQGR